MKYIKWDYDILGYLSKEEKRNCEAIDKYLEILHSRNKNISVVISIDGGNQFHIKNNEESLIGYMTAEQCKEMLPDIDEYSDVVYYPGKEHYTEFKILIEDLKSDNPPVVTTQNKEFIEYLLESDLDFNVTTAYLDEDDKKLAHRDVTKEIAKEMVYSMGLELR